MQADLSEIMKPFVEKKFLKCEPAFIYLLHSLSGIYPLFWMLLANCLVVVVVVKILHIPSTHLCRDLMMHGNDLNSYPILSQRKYVCIPISYLFDIL